MSAVVALCEFAGALRLLAYFLEVAARITAKMPHMPSQIFRGFFSELRV
jgi:hypothetical protein